MKVKIDDLECQLDEHNVVIARNSVNSFLDVVRRGALLKHNEALYLTTLIMMYKKSTELLDEFGAENVMYVLDQYYGATAQMDET